MIQISKTDIKELTHEQLMSWFQERQMASYRARQILKWIYLRQADTFDVMTDLGKSLRETLSDHFTISRLKKEQVEISKDGSEKYLLN